jgi:hypothetical protein
VKEAARIFRLFPDPKEAQTLKSDVLGLDSDALITPLGIIDLLHLLSAMNANTLINRDQLRGLFRAIRPEQIPQISQVIVRNAEAFARWKDVINDGLISSATRESITHDLPGGIRKLILMSRPELIDRENVAELPNEELLELSAAHPDEAVARALSSAMVRRDFGSVNTQLFRSMPSVMFEAAIEAHGKQELNYVWIHVIGDSADLVLRTKWPVGVNSTSELAVGLELLRFPRNTGKPLDVWVDALESAHDDVSGNDRIKLQAFLLEEALQLETPSSWALIATVLPELRPTILRGGLPHDVQEMLLNDLPRFKTAAYWDLNKRILVALSHLRARIPYDHKLEKALSLSDEELNTFLNGAAEESERSKARFWWW